MDNFIFQNPVKLIMGRGMIARLSNCLLYTSDAADE